MAPPAATPEVLAFLRPYAEGLQVDPVFLLRFLACLYELHVKGIPFKVGELRRPTATQARLYAQGRTAPGPIVTYAKPGQSKHESGKAGHIIVDRKHRTALGTAAEGAGLTWGGRWTNKFGPDGDWQHVEIP